MLDILSITGVIFVVIAVGYASVKQGAFDARDMQTFGRFVVTLALPALIFQAVATRPVTEIMNAGYLGAYTAGSLAVYGAGYWWSRRFAKGSVLVSLYRAMGMSCPNSGFVGYPVLLMALPEIAATALALNMIVENLLLLPMTLILAEKACGGSVRGIALAGQIAGRLVRNPILIGLVAGLVVSVSGISLPDVIARPVSLLASASAALSLTVIGGTLATMTVRRIDPAIWGVVAGKLLVHPLAVGLGLAGMSALGLGVGDARLAAGAVIIAAGPVMSIYPILAQRHGQEESASIAMFVMTILSFITISLAMAITLP